MTSLRIVREIDRPPDDVWGELRHLDRHVQWMHDAVRIDFRGTRREGVGTSFECLTRVGPFTTRDVMTITSWNEGVTMGVDHHGMIAGSGEFTLTPTARGTLVTWRETLRFPWWLGGAVAAACARPVLRSIWRKNLEALDALVTASRT